MKNKQTNKKNNTKQIDDKKETKYVTIRKVKSHWHKYK